MRSPRPTPETAVFALQPGRRRTPMAENESGLTDDECKELHATFMKGTYIWAGAALFAHFLVYSWMPWFPG
jgi:light-harvesting complex 1 beta chain